MLPPPRPGHLKLDEQSWTLPQRLQKGHGPAQALISDSGFQN